MELARGLYRPRQDYRSAGHDRRGERFQPRGCMTGQSVLIVTKMQPAGVTNWRHRPWLSAGQESQGRMVGAGCVTFKGGDCARSVMLVCRSISRFCCSSRSSILRRIISAPRTLARLGRQVPGAAWRTQSTMSADAFRWRVRRCCGSIRACKKLVR